MNPASGGHKNVLMLVVIAEAVRRHRSEDLARSGPYRCMLDRMADQDVRRSFAPFDRRFPDPRQPDCGPRSTAAPDGPRPTQRKSIFDRGRLCCMVAASIFDEFLRPAAQTAGARAVVPAT